MTNDNTCAGFPDLRRPNYFFGQLLGPREFAGEQAYFRDKLRLAIRCLEGYGVVCGYTVTPVPRPADCDSGVDGKIGEIREAIEALARDTTPEAAAKREALIKELDALNQQAACDPPKTPTLVQVSCGLAYDCEGYELLLRTPRTVDIWNSLTSEDQKTYRDIFSTTRQLPPLYLSVCRCEQPIEPVRPVVSGDCGVPNDCQFGWTREGVTFRVTVSAPTADERCETCCNGCCDDPADPCRGEKPCGDCGCLLLARIDNFRPGGAVQPTDIANGVRRPMTKYVPAAVSGVSWSHGAVYSRDDAWTILGSDKDPGGLYIHFSRPVRAETITDGVIDVWVIEGGRGASAQIKHLSGEFVGKPDSGLIDSVRYRSTSDDAPDPGDRVLIQVRTNFILDACCRAVDGENLGGHVPLHGMFGERAAWRKDQPAKAVCLSSNLAFPALWTSGDGHPGGDFLSWFFVESKNKKQGAQS